MEDFKPGIYPDMDIDVYHSSPGISSSGINLILDCPAKYHYQYILGNKKSNDDFVIGSAVHVLILEPLTFEDRFFIYEKDRLPGTEDAKKALQLEAGGKMIIKRSDLEIVYGMVNSAKKHRIWSTLENIRVEHSLFWHGGVFDTPLRARPDLISNQMIIDIKTTKNIDGFDRSVFNFGNHRQAAMQIDGVYALTRKLMPFGWFLIEKEPPYLTACFYANDDDVEQGRREYLEGACKFSECMLFDDWPGYPEDFQEIRLPRYARTEGY